MGPIRRGSGGERWLTASAAAPESTTAPATEAAEQIEVAGPGAWIGLAAYESDRARFHAAGDVVLFFNADWCPTCRFIDVELMGAKSRVVTSGEMDKSVFLASGLPTPAKGKCYQVWRVNPDGSKESAGVFVPDADGHVAVVLEGGAEESTFVITVEPPGGSKAPTGEMVGQVTT